MTDPATWGSKPQSPTIPPAPERENRLIGRGGAGNFVWETEADIRAKRDGAKKQTSIAEDVAKDVEAMLAKPGRAVLRADGLKE
jgi:hypothetical protein